MAINLFVMNHELVWEDPDIYAIRVPYAHLGLDHTNCYVIRDGDDALIIDVGVPSPAANIALEKAITEIGVDMQRARFFATHLHFDHVALLKQMTQPGSKILMSRTSFELNPWNQYKTRKAAVREKVKKEGITQLATLGLAAIMSESRVCDLAKREYELLEDNDEVRVGKHALRVVATPGHAHGHLCLYSDEQQFLISGDHILETITPGIALPLDGLDSMHDYLASLDKVQALPCRAVLPGHGEAFYDLEERINWLRQHHADRIAKVYEVIALSPGIDGNGVLRKMPWKRSGPFRQWDHLNAFLRLSMGVLTLAYLEYLVNLGEIERAEDKTGNHYHVI